MVTTLLDEHHLLMGCVDEFTIVNVPFLLALRYFSSLCRAGVDAMLTGTDKTEKVVCGTKLTKKR